MSGKEKISKNLTGKANDLTLGTNLCNAAVHSLSW